MPDLLTPALVIAATLSPELATHRERAERWNSDDIRVKPVELTDPILADLLAAANSIADAKFGRVVKAIIDARGGEIKKIPSFAAAPEILLAYLRQGMINGWLYESGSDGHMHPALVTSIKIEPARGHQDEPRLVIQLTSDFPFRGQRDSRSNNDRAGAVSKSISLSKGDVARKSPADVLLKQGWVRETPELLEAYQERVEKFREILVNGFAQQYRYSGTPTKEESYRTQNERTNRRVVHDVKRSEILPARDTAPSMLAPGKDEEDEDAQRLLPIPVQTVVRIFDLGSHEFFTVNTNDLTKYVYDKTLKDKLILPDDQRELLDVLTTDLDAFTADIVEGKSAGNVVLAKGSPGVGKTLTAEVYAEIVERPLYSIHSGVLGTTAETVRSSLEAAFTLAKRWNAVMLLDEADVFVLARGRDIAQNAITAEFLRTLEYFDGLLFMTTNRSDDIDDAIISRCAALIDYKVPEADDAFKIWQVLAKNMGLELPTLLTNELIENLPQASPRDMKMLLRLTARMAASRGVEMSTEIFARCSMFRGLHWGGQPTSFLKESYPSVPRSITGRSSRPARSCAKTTPHNNHRWQSEGVEYRCPGHS